MAISAAHFGTAYVQGICRQRIRPAADTIMQLSIHVTHIITVDLWEFDELALQPLMGCLLAVQILESYVDIKHKSRTLHVRKKKERPQKFRVTNLVAYSIMYAPSFQRQIGSQLYICANIFQQPVVNQVHMCADRWGRC